MFVGLVPGGRVKIATLLGASDPEKKAATVICPVNGAWTASPMKPSVPLLPSQVVNVPSKQFAAPGVSAWTYPTNEEALTGRMRRVKIRINAKKRGTRSRFMVWLQVVWSLIEAEAESEDFDPWTDGSDKENHRFKDQQSLALALT